MPFVTLPGGIRAHIKLAKRPAKRCSCAGCRIAACFQCDYPLGNGRTCDAHLCHQHAHEVGADLHRCPRHHGAPEQAGLL